MTYHRRCCCFLNAVGHLFSVIVRPRQGWWAAPTVELAHWSVDAHSSIQLDERVKMKVLKLPFFVFMTIIWKGERVLEYLILANVTFWEFLPFTRKLLLRSSFFRQNHKKRSLGSIGRVWSSVSCWWRWWLPKQHPQKGDRSQWWRTGGFCGRDPWQYLSNCRGGSKGSGSRGSGRSNHPSGDDSDGGIGGSGIRTDKPPCVGLCYYNKLHGIPQESTTPRCEFTVSWSN